MNFRTKIFQLYVPAFVQKKMLSQLFGLTAHAFRCEAPKMEGFSYEERLKEYALFTKREAEKAIREGQELEAIKNRLYKNAYQLGQKLRRNFRIRSREEVMTMSRILYRLLRIKFHGNFQGDVTISRCFFSNFYSSEVCQIITFLDEGIAAGLSGGGKLHFYQMITEGKDCCKAHFVLDKG
jgi:hypothetical protein